MMKDDDFKLSRGSDDERTDRWTDICDCRVAFATENLVVDGAGGYTNKSNIVFVHVPVRPRKARRVRDGT